MHRPVPPIHESADDLKQALSRERHPHTRQRLPALFLLASGQARTRGDVATLLGVDRNTVGRWLVRYDHGGLAQLLALYVSPGKPPALRPDQLAQLQARLQTPEGFGSYGEIRQWIATTLGVQMGYHAVHTLVHDKLGARPTGARPRHEKTRTTA